MYIYGISTLIYTYTYIYIWDYRGYVRIKNHRSDSWGTLCHDDSAGDFLWGSCGNDCDDNPQVVGSFLVTKYRNTVDGRNQNHQLIGGKHPIIYRVSTIQGGAGFLPSTVWLQTLINYTVGVPSQLCLLVFIPTNKLVVTTINPNDSI